MQSFMTTKTSSNLHASRSTFTLGAALSFVADIKYIKIETVSLNVKSISQYYCFTAFFFKPNECRLSEHK